MENTEVAGHERSTGRDQVVKPASAKGTLSRDMTVAIEMGHTTAGAPATLDLEELLATRLLVQGNSGSGKSHLLRRLLEQSAPWVQQTIIDPEGDFVALADRFGHLLIDAEDHTERGLQVAGERARIHRVSTVLNLEGLDAENQMRRAAAFLGGLFDVARDHWYPMLVVVDEAQLFAPAVAGEVSDEARKLSLGAMTNLMCRGRKRGLAGVIATQRLPKLTKNVAAEGRARSRASLDMSGEKTRQCRADIRLAWWIGSGAPASEGRAGGRKRQRTTKLVGIQLRQRSAPDPSDRAQGEQQCSLKAVACPDGIHRSDCGRLDLHQTRFSVPGLGSIDPARNDDQTCTSRNKRPRPFIVAAAAIEKFKIDIRHPHDVGGGGKCIHLIDVARLVPDQVGPAIRIEGDGG